MAQRSREEEKAMFANMALKGMLGSTVKRRPVIGLQMFQRLPTYDVHPATGKKIPWIEAQFHVIDVNRPEAEPLANVKVYRRHRQTLEGKKLTVARVGWFGEGLGKNIHANPLDYTVHQRLSPQVIRDAMKVFIWQNPEFDLIEGGRQYGWGVYTTQAGEQRRPSSKMQKMRAKTIRRYLKLKTPQEKRKETIARKKQQMRFDFGD